MYITTQISTLLLKIATQTCEPKWVVTCPNHFGLSFLGSYSDNYFFQIILVNTYLLVLSLTTDLCM